jgi:uncharacterized OsmC-like protein
MSDHNFHLRLASTYNAENQPVVLNVEVYENNQWQTLLLNHASPGFLVYVYAIFTCQHLYLRTNSSERNLQLASSTGEIRIRADAEWALRSVSVHFEAALAKGTAGREDIEYIISRMKQCPVSKNLPATARIETSVDFSNDHAG